MEQGSSCGLFDCGPCKFRLDSLCLGCEQGNVMLAKWGRDQCRIYSCVQSRGLSSCRQCGEAICELRGGAELVCPLRGGMEDRKDWVLRIARHLEGQGVPCHTGPSVPLKTLMRLRWYLSALEHFESRGIDVVSSQEIAERLGMGSAMVRKDLSALGELGTPGLGYRVRFLKDRIGQTLHQNTCKLAWVGAEWLSFAHAMLSSSMGLNFEVVAALDSRSEWVGKTIGKWTIRPLSELPALMTGQSIDGAILALPEDAVHAADAIVQAGAKGILNLTPAALRVPPRVHVHHIDLLGEIMALALECGVETPRA